MHAPPGVDPDLAARLYAQAGADRWGVPLERFSTALAASLAHGLGADPGSRRDSLSIERYLSSLHLADLALSIACAAGHDEAWNHFVAEHRSVLYRAAAAIDPANGGRDLADSIYADLFGLTSKDGERQSLFRYFHGRSRLGTWLRAVLAQRQIDRVRVIRRHEPLVEETAPAAAQDTPSHDPERPRFVTAVREAMSAAIAALAPRDRLRLSCYYAQDQTLAAIGRALGEHEATVSRHLTRTRREIGAAVVARLRNRHGMDDRTAAECLRSVSEDAGALDLADLLGIRQDRKKGDPERSNK